MRQSRRASALEAVANTALGFCISLLATLIILPAAGVAATSGQSVAITLGFTVISLVRGYTLRRLFNRPHPAGLAPTHYHIDSRGVSVYRGGVPVARMEMSGDQLIGMAQEALRASRERETGYPVK